MRFEDWVHSHRLLRISRRWIRNQHLVVGIWPVEMEFVAEWNEELLEVDTGGGNEALSDDGPSDGLYQCVWDGKEVGSLTKEHGHTKQHVQCPSVL